VNIAAGYCKGAAQCGLLCDRRGGSVQRRGDVLQSVIDGDHQHRAAGLGWFSIGLGLWEMLAPRSVARAIGMPDASPAVLRGFGAREIANGIAILRDPQGAQWLWGRVGGDALDLSYLATGLNGEHNKARVMAAIGAVAGVAALDVICAAQLSRTATLEVTDVVTINEPASTVFNQWASSGVFGTMELLDSREGESILWTASDAHQEIVGDVRFQPAPGGRGTEVRVRASGISEGELRHRLRKFKQIVETGEEVLSDGPALWRPAQPQASDSTRATEVQA
jgi:uncharacterized membrane protein